VRLWLGLDFGTTSAKALLVDEDGTVRARASSRYATRFGPRGVAEQDPEDYLRAARELIAACAPAGRPDAIGLCGHTPSEVFVDADGAPVRPAITWQDLRAAPEAAELRATLGDPVALVGSSIPWAPGYAPAKLLWLSRHEARTVERCRWVLQPKDYAGLRLTGSAASDAWSSRALCNVVTGEPARDVLAAVGWPAAAVPEVAPAWACRGRVSPEAARQFGAPAGVPVSIGWSDALAGVLAIGAFEAPSAFIGCGTADVVGLSAPDVPPDATPLFSVPASCAPLPLAYGPTQASGAAIAWIRAIASGEPETWARRHPLDENPDAAAEMPVFVPYLAGERAPVWRNDVRGLFLGLGLEHGTSDLLAAVDAGVACSGRDVLEAAERVVGRRADEVRLGGATSASAYWRHLRAAVLGRPVLVHGEPETSALGAAILAACAAGVRLGDASRLRGTPERVEPTDWQREAGEALFARYVRARGVAIDWADASHAAAGGDDGNATA
jgi:xylulokinase